MDTTAHINATVYSPDGRLILTASDDGTAGLWDAADGKIPRTLKGHGPGAVGDVLEGREPDPDNLKRQDRAAFKEHRDRRTGRQAV